MTLKDYARDFGIGFGTWFSKRSVLIARRVSFGAHCLIGSCTIGEATLIGSNIDILSGRHHHPIDEHVGRRSQMKNKTSQVQIGSNVWVCNRVVVMADIGDNCVIVREVWL